MFGLGEAHERPTLRPVVDGDPTRDVTVLEGQGKHLAAIMKGGRFHKNRLGAAA